MFWVALVAFVLAEPTLHLSQAMGPPCKQPSPLVAEPSEDKTNTPLLSPNSLKNPQKHCVTTFSSYCSVTVFLKSDDREGYTLKLNS